MEALGYRRERLGLTPAQALRFALADWPPNLTRMLAWQIWEGVQHRFPGRFGRRPGDEMILGQGGMQGTAKPA